MQRGHDETRLWQSTPRQLVARLHFSERIQRQNDARALSLGASAARGEGKDLKRQITELTRDVP